MTTSLYVKGSETGAKAQNAEWFASDIDVGVQNNKALQIFLQVSVSVTAAVIEITFDSGSTWAALNDGNAVTLGALNVFPVIAKEGDLINFRATNASGTTLDICYVIGSLTA